MYSIGLDVHQGSTALCILGPTGRVAKRESIKGHPRRVVEWLRQLEYPFRACDEATYSYGWLYDQLRPPRRSRGRGPSRPPATDLPFSAQV